MSLHRRERRAKTISSSEDEDGKASNLVEKLLKGGLLKSIEKVVEQQTARVLSKHLDGRPIDVEQPVGGASTETVDENMDPFDPDNKDMNVEQWLAKIDRLSVIQGWSEYETTCFMQMKLKGAARSWFKQNCNYDLSWPEWKKFLIQSFPPQYDFADLLTELLARKKLLEESMAYYFEVKFALCERCGFDGEKAVSLLIHGLPADVAVMARAANCKTPQELYSLLIAELDEYDTGSSSSKRPNNTSFTSAEKTQVELDEYEAESPTIQSVSYSSTTKTKMARYDEYETESSSGKKHGLSYASMEKRTEERDEYETKSPTTKRQSVSYASTSKTKMARLEYEIEPSSHKRRSRSKSEDEELVKRSSSRERVLQRCYNCQEMTTHYSRNCPKPRIERCNVCKHMGHLAFKCPRDRDRRSEHPRRHHHRSKNGRD